jgi:hypothetical protein
MVSGFSLNNEVSGAPATIMYLPGGKKYSMQ